ncbi:MAG: ClpXP protease specificity-enhancing factor SspB [Pseudomonadota bacterium]
MSDTIEYGTLMHDAMRGLIQQVLQDVSDAAALPGDHHFFITFDTLHPDVEMADWLSDRYPGEMTIVMQHWFDNLDVTDVGFAVTLNFGDSPEPLYVPYTAIKTFVDPSVEFGLRFETQDDADADDQSPVELVRDAPDAPEQAAMAPSSEPDEPQDHTTGTSDDTKGADVVSLDSFRKS